MIDPLLSRPAPVDDPVTRFFWNSGADGLLRILRCAACGYFAHPPTSRCPRCLAAEIAPEVVSGRGTVHTFTVNIQEWVPGQEPYVYAVVELAEQDGLRLTSNIVGVPVEQVHIGMAVRVAFVERHDAYYPLFTPEEPA